MVNEEILSGLKSAISHGSTLEQAMLSFVNAGYNTQEVREAAALVSQPQQAPMQQIQQAQPSPLPTNNQIMESKKKKKIPIAITLLIIAIAILISAIISIMLFWKEIISYFS